MKNIDKKTVEDFGEEWNKYNQSSIPDEELKKSWNQYFDMFSFEELSNDSEGFDMYGNYSFGIKEHIIFPEINFDKVDRIRGMDITIVTSGNNKETTLALLKSVNFPFIDKKKNN